MENNKSKRLTRCVDAEWNSGRVTEADGCSAFVNIWFIRLECAECDFVPLLQHRFRIGPQKYCLTQFA